jgi:hypothetical protein
MKRLDVLHDPNRTVYPVSDARVAASHHRVSTAVAATAASYQSRQLP